MKMLALVLATSALVACTQPSTSTDASTDATRTTDAAASPAREGGDTMPQPAPSPSVPPMTSTPEAPPADASNPADSAPMEADYLGRWTGVEGMYLVVAKKPAGGVTLEMQWDLDHKGTFDGSVTAEGLRFERDGAAETAVRTNGDATGLKYLAGKKNCLTVKPGEGYCRD